MVLDNFRTIELIWDKANKSIIKTIKTASSDTTGRYFSVKVLDEGQEVDLTGAKLQLYWEHPNFNTNGTDNFTTVDTKGKFTLTFSDEMLTNVGELNAHLVLMLSDGKITSDGFTIVVFKGADGGVVVPTNGNGLVKQIDDKIDKGNVTLTDLTQEVKLAMTGGAVAIVGENAVGTENVKDSAITKTKTNFINVLGKPLIDETTPMLAGHLDFNTGEFTSGGTMKTTDYVQLQANAQYMLDFDALNDDGVAVTWPREIVIYDQNNSKVESLNAPLNKGKVITYTTPMKIRVNYNLGVNGGTINTFKLYDINAVPLNVLEPDIKISSESIQDKSISLSKINDEVITEYDPSVINLDTEFLRGYLDFTTGDFVSNSTRNYTTDFIELEPNVDYKLEFSVQDGAGTVFTKPRVFYIYNGDNSKSRYLFANTETGVFRLTGAERKVRLNIGVSTDPMNIDFIRLYKVSDGYEVKTLLNPNISINATSVDGLSDVDSYDQSLNTYDNVSFASVSTSGMVPTGTLANPPIGIQNGDVWADTTDSTIHPILRVML